MNKEEMLNKTKEKAEEILLPAAKQFAGAVIEDILMASVKEMVADSENPYDDMVLAALKPILDKKIAEFLAPEAPAAV